MIGARCRPASRVFDIDPPSSMLELGGRLRQQFGTGRRTLLAASTREGEEALLLDSLKDIHLPGLLLVIVPRHPQRFEVVIDLLKQRGISFIRRSELGHNPGSLNDHQTVSLDIPVVLGDSMGEMFAYYVAADLAFIGGSLLPFGGQNLIESCAVGTPVLVGPYMYNFEEASRLAVSAGAAIQVTDVEEFGFELQQFFLHPVVQDEMRKHCFSFVASNRGATEKSLQLVRKYL